MRLSDETKHVLRTMLAIDFPSDIYFDVDSAGTVEAQCHTQDEVRRARVAFGGGVVWEKKWHEDCRWWSYHALVPQGFRVDLYACREAPASCTAIEEEYEAEENVPVQFERRTVTKKRLRWDCSGGSEVQP